MKTPVLTIDLSRVFHTSPDWMTISTWEEGIIIEANEAFLKGTGFTYDKVINRTLQEIDIWENKEDRQLLISKIRNRGSFRNEEVRFRTKSGRSKTILWSCEIMDIDGRKFLLGIGRDITHYRYLENELHRAQRMDSLGRLAGSIAHDFNNLLTAIDGFSDLILLKVEDTEAVSNYVKRIKDIKNSASSFIKHLLLFSRRQPVQPESVDINGVIGDMQSLLAPVMGDMIDLRLMLDEQSCPVLADKSRIEQVIMNLSLNARDAMPKGGTFTLNTSNIHVDEALAEKYVDLEPEDYVKVIISDTGVGMDDETASQVFEPFFSTKRSGKGIGLGLTTVYSIVKQAGGSLHLRTESGKGTAFTIYLPCLPEAGVITGAGTRLSEPRSNSGPNK